MAAPKPPTACRRCFKAIPHGTGERGFCADCVKEIPNQAVVRHEYRRHPVYDTYRWKHTTRPTMFAYNPQCQFLIGVGQQCQRPTELVHHIVSPHVNAALAHNPANLVCLCRDCHPTTEGDLSPRPYVPTRFPAGFQVIEYPHPIPGNTAPGGSIPDAQPLDLTIDYTKLLNLPSQTPR